jgi:hypothetical protein
MMDSRAFRTSLRSVLLVVADPDAEEGENAGLVALDKVNAGPLGVPALRYRIRSASYIVEEADHDTGEITQKLGSCGVVDWVGQVDGDGRDLARSFLRPHIEKEESPAHWLRGYLADAGETAREDVIEAGKKAGFSLTAIKLAAQSIGVISREEKGYDKDTRTPWRWAFWSLRPTLPPKSVHTQPTGPTQPTWGESSGPTGPIYAGQSELAELAESVKRGPTLDVRSTDPRDSLYPEDTAIPLPFDSAEVELDQAT